MIDAKPFPIRFNKIDGFIWFCDGIRYLVLFGSEKYDFIYDRVRYLTGVKSITYVISHIYAKIKADSYDSLPVEKAMTFYNVIILIKSDWNKDKNNYYYNIFLEKTLCQLPKK